MARVSFNLRSPAAVGGSHNRYDTTVFGARTDYDSALRADGLQTAPATSPLGKGQSFFEVTCSCYNEVDLAWDVPFLPRTAGASVGSVPEITGTVIVYSALGEPTTLASGDVLLETSTYFTYQHTGVPSGKWAYYSMFARYQSSLGDDYYERVASLSTLVPTNYGSTLQLWRRIPEYYRLQDSQLGTTDYSPCIGTVDLSGRVGPLFKYLSFIGFDMDRMRTTIDYTMAARDPDVSNTEVLDALAAQMGVPMRSTDLGSARLRRVLGDIGEYRRTKGTKSALEYLGQSITGADVSVNNDTGDITIFSQRVNYITDPKDGTGIVSHRPAGDDEIATPLDFTSTSYHASSGQYTLTGTKFAPNTSGASAGYDIYGNWNLTVGFGNANTSGAAVYLGGYLYLNNLDTNGNNQSAGLAAISIGDVIRVGGWSFTVSSSTNNSTHYQFGGTFSASDTPVDTVAVKVVSPYSNCVMIRLTSPIYVKDGDRACFSVQSGIGTNAIKWARLYDVATDTILTDSTGAALTDSLGIPLTTTGWIQGSGMSSTPTLAAGHRAFEIPVRTLYPGAWAAVGVEFLIDLRLAPNGFVLENMLLERNRLSYYFDGSTVRGGWLIDSSSVSDYRWSGSAFSSPSLYAEEYKRTNGILDKTLISEAVPINEASSFRIASYNAIPGIGV